MLPWYSFFAVFILTSLFHISSCIWAKSQEPVTKYIYLQVYYGKNAGEYVNLPFSQRSSLNSTKGFNSSYTSIFYFPGWGEYPRLDKGLWPSLQVLIPAFRSLPDTNLVVFDYWELIKFNNYITAIQNATIMGGILAQFFDEHIPNIQPREKVHLIGHSLGCQISSNVARSFIKLGKKFSRITGLDPAGPGFKLTGDHLQASDADYVDIIHTNADFLGLAGLGTINFYVNGGTIQPSCLSSNWTMGCSHYFSWRVYSESIYNPSGFLSKKCTDRCQDTFPICKCNDNDLAYIAYKHNTSKTGSYFLSTNYKSPYAMGQNGIIFNKPGSWVKNTVGNISPFRSLKTKVGAVLKSNFIQL